MNIINVFNEKGKSLEQIMKEFFLSFYLNNEVFKEND